MKPLPVQVETCSCVASDVCQLTNVKLSFRTEEIRNEVDHNEQLMCIEVISARVRPQQKTAWCSGKGGYRGKQTSCIPAVSFEVSWSGLG